MGIEILRWLPPSVSLWLLRYGLPIVLFLRYLSGSLFGVLILVSGIYMAMSWVGHPKPWSTAELAIWVSNLPAEYKSAVISSVITIVGFLIAFRTATENWRAESLAHLRASVAGEVEVFFSEFLRCSDQARIYAESLVETIDQLQKQGASDDAIFSVQYALEHAGEFQATRNRLSALSVEVHRLIGRNTLVLSSLAGAVDFAHDAAAAVTEVSDSMWIRVPAVAPNSSEFITAFFSQVNVAECARFIECSSRNNGRISALTGGVRGGLLAGIVRPTFSMSRMMSKNGQMAVEAMAQLRRKQ